MAGEILAESLDQMSLFRPPVIRSAKAVLDRTSFSRIIPLSAARILDSKNIFPYRKQLEKTKEILAVSRLLNVRPDPDAEVASRGGKCVVLAPEVKHEDPNTWSHVLQEAVKAEEVKVVPYDLKLGYEYWNYHDIMTALLPEDAQGEIPVGFAVVGHIAHLNLRDEYKKHRKVIAEVLMDKNSQIRTVINKIDTVGAESEFRTFNYEVLAGPDDMNVELTEGDCIFRFDYSKVYWNSRLQTEHKRLVDAFHPGEVVVDVMAGIGPFALPAGKKGVFVWANDLNPNSYKYLAEGVVKNKVEKFVRPFCQDARNFIKYATTELLHLTSTAQNIITIQAKPTRIRTHCSYAAPRTLVLPSTPAHFVMNLPATAIDFCDAFVGLYAGYEGLFEPYTETALPLVHVHCFSTKSKDNALEEADICARLTAALGYVMRPMLSRGDKKAPPEGEVRIWDVRDVAPKKRMFCAEYRLPKAVAFNRRKRSLAAPQI